MRRNLPCRRGLQLTKLVAGRFFALTSRIFPTSIVMPTAYENPSNDVPLPAAALCARPDLFGMAVTCVQGATIARIPSSES